MTQRCQVYIIYIIYKYIYYNYMYYLKINILLGFQGNLIKILLQARILIRKFLMYHFIQCSAIVKRDA